MANDDLCPQCGEPLEFDEVDIGVGVLRGNPRCFDCQWVEDDSDWIRGDNDDRENEV